MKKQIITTTAVAVLATSIIFSCKKKDETTPDTTASTTSSTTTAGSTTGSTTSGASTLTVNQWGANGTVYTATNVANNPYWGKDTYGTCNLSAKAVVGDTTIILQYRFPTYLMASGIYSIAIASNTFASNVVNVSINKSFSTAPYFINNYVTTGGTATITNTGGIFTIESNNVGLNNMSLSSKLVSTNPTIPSANASFTTPVGVAPNQYMIGVTSYTPNQLDISLDASGSFKYEGSLTSTPQKALKYWFSSSYPPSGTYDVVASKGSLAAGKIYIEFVSTSPVEQYQSLAGTTATVITNANDVSVTINNVVLNKLVGAGSQTLTASGNLTH